MKLTVITEDDQFKEIELDQDSIVQDVKEVLQIEFGIPMQQQELFSNNKVMNNQKKIKEYCNDNDMIRLSIKIPTNPLFGGINNNNNNNSNNLNNASNIANALGNLLGGSFQQNIHQKYLQQAREFKQQIRTTPYVLDNIKRQNASLATLLQNGSDEELANYLQKNDEERIQKRMKEQQELDELEKDPFNPDNQRKIEDIINQRQIDENLEMAQEYIPEVFGKISMLYIDCVINNHPIQAFVDTGAESTIMSKACAERCGLMRLVDKRFSGMASGVGTGKILGRIHKYAIQILDQRFECSFTVLESINLDFLLGLDNMKRFQCCVNLKDNTLNFWLVDKELKVPFLHEKDIKKTVCIEQEQKLFDESQLMDEEKPKNNNEMKLNQQQPQQNQQQGVAIGGNAGMKQQDIDTLVQMFGVTKDQAIAALRSTQGNVELAGSILAMKKF